jgi:cytochrome P450
MTTDSTTRTPGEFTFPSAEVQECPFPFYDALRTDAPVYRIPGREEFVVSRWEDIVYISQHPEVFSSVLTSVEYGRAEHGPDDSTSEEFGYAPTSMAHCEGAEHKTKRAIGLKLMSRERLRSYDPIVREHCATLIDAFIDRGARTCSY